MIPQKRTAEHFGRDHTTQQQNDSNVDLSHTDTRLPPVRWLFEQAHSFDDLPPRLPSLADERSGSTTPARLEVSRSVSRASNRQRRPPAPRVAEGPSDEMVCYGMVS